MSVRAKFKVQRFESWKQSQWRDGKETPGVEVRNVVLSPVTSGSEENLKFFNATPSGEIKLGIINPEAWGQFELGKEYYVDFTPAG